MVGGRWGREPRRARAVPVTGRCRRGCLGGGRRFGAERPARRLLVGLCGWSGGPPLCSGCSLQSYSTQYGSCSEPSRTCWSQSQDTVRCVDVTAGAALASGCRTFVNGSRTADLSIQIRHRAGTRVHYRLYKQVAIGAPFCTHAYMHVARLLTVQVFTNNELRNKQKRNGVQASGYTLQL